jgi:hypothetical protein
MQNTWNPNIPSSRSIIYLSGPIPFICLNSWHPFPNTFLEKHIICEIFTNSNQTLCSKLVIYVCGHRCHWIGIHCYKIFSLFAIFLTNLSHEVLQFHAYSKHWDTHFVIHIYITVRIFNFCTHLMPCTSS